MAAVNLLLATVGLALRPYTTPLSVTADPPGVGYVAVRPAAWGTVSAYFPVKEQLVFHDHEEVFGQLEARLERAISLQKGCYVGQEIIIRIKHRGHVARKLSGLKFAKSVESRATITSEDGKEIGRVTSSTFSPRLESPIALGYVRYEYLSAGTAVKVNDNTGTVTDLPNPSRAR